MTVVPVRMGGHEVVDRRTSHTYSTMAQIGEGKFEVDERKSKACVWALKHTKKREEEGGHLRRFAGLLTRPVRMYLCSFEGQVC
jgi:hypothetical protein